MTYNCIILYGPTASGKSALAYELADRMPIEIINMDSVQVYKHFDIGSAKPDLLIQKQFKHHLIDILEIPQSYSVADYLVSLDVCIKKVRQSGKIPLLVGGTMLYLNAILANGLIDVPTIDSNIKNSIQRSLMCLTQKQRYDLLLKYDPKWALGIHPNDTQRTLRGLMVYFAFDKPLTMFTKQQRNYDFKPLLMSISEFERSWLHNTINLRVDEMIKAGLIEEVMSLIERYPKYLDHSAFKSIGYRQIINMLYEHQSKTEVIEKINAATRQFAKRQLTWMRKVNADIKMNPNALNIRKIQSWLISHGF
tara:strand:- start:510 stop:1433 length:924 start_codon:yes stop_codon:yes gene_type:complete